VGCRSSQASNDNEIEQTKSVKTPFSFARKKDIAPSCRPPCLEDRKGSSGPYGRVYRSSQVCNDPHSHSVSGVAMEPEGSGRARCHTAAAGAAPTAPHRLNQPLPPTAGACCDVHAAPRSTHAVAAGLEVAAMSRDQIKGVGRSRNIGTAALSLVSADLHHFREPFQV
jgi:hypothetical protein